MQNSKTIPVRKDIDEKFKWDLTPLFNSDEEWETLYKKLELEIEGYTKFKGKLGESFSMFKEAFDFDLALSRELEKLYTYAHLKNDEDKTNQHYQGIYERAINLYNRVSELSSYMTPEIHALPDETISSYLREPALKDFQFFMEKMLRYKPHTLSQEIEQILAMGGEITSAPSQFFSQLDNADLRFGPITDDEGREVELSHGNFITFLMSPRAETRKKAFHQYYRVYDHHKHSIASALSFSTKKDRFYSRVRKFDSARKSSLFSDNVDESVYDNLITTVKQNISPLFTYLNFRKEALALPELHFYDTYVPLVKDISFHMTYEEAVSTCVNALRPLGDDYTETLLKGLLGGWVDRYENKGKRSGAYSSGCYDSPPYILMNYRDDNINSLYTLIHESGHSMHSYYSAKNQPFHYHGYTIFVAEVASTFNEVLLSSYLLEENRNDPRMQAYILNREIDNIRGTLFRQTMFAEFEKLSHEIVEKEEPLILDRMTEIYGGLLKEYFGDTIIIDEELKLECLRIPHFYSPFYVYKYSTGISAAIALAKNVMKNGDAACDKYLKFLGMGGTMFPIDELKAAGVDMSKPEPVISAIEHFESLVDRFIKVYKEI